MLLNLIDNKIVYMPSLKYVFKDQDFDFIKICAKNWHLDIKSSDKKSAINEFIIRISEVNTINYYINNLPQDSKIAFDFLLEHQGKFPSLQYLHQFGEIRVMGPARRDREKPYKNPISPVEDLWYRGLIGKSFLEDASLLEEYFYIPDEIMQSLIPEKSENEYQFGEAALPEQHLVEYLANDTILDYMCTMLSSCRNNKEISTPTLNKWKISYSALSELFRAVNLINVDNQPNPDITKNYLEADRGQALLQLYNDWINNEQFNELHLIPDLVFEGKWKNDPIRTRKTLLGFVEKVPENTWWSIPSFINAIKKLNPDFQRSAGEYDSWYIRKSNSKQYFKGISSWHEVEGELITHFITGPLHWLGITDLGSPSKSAKPSSFRLSRWSQQILNDRIPLPIKEEKEKVIIISNGNIYISPLCPRAIRYQISRFCNWIEDKKEYWYHLTPSSLQNAKGQGLKTKYLLKLLESHGKSPIPPGIKKAINNWDQNGSQAIIEQHTILTADTAEIINALEKSNAHRFLGKKLNPTTIIIKGNAREHIRKALAENGYLIDSQD